MTFETLTIKNIKVNKDNRGFFFESFRNKSFSKNKFVQDNISYSKKGVIRGMHFQFKYPQTKLITIINGRIFDIVIDLRKKSKTFLNVFTFDLNSKETNQLYVPRGFAHGFQCISKEAVIYYKTDNYYAPNDEYGINPLDALIKDKWPIKKKIINKKDKKLPNILKLNKFFH